jgi:serine/threonine protein kinase
MDNLVGQTLNRYKIASLIGEGGMGSVYKAHDITLQRDVAIKVMHANYARLPDFQERFLQEARTAARLDHPGIVQVYDFGQHRGALYIVMKFIPGDNLEKMLRDLREQNRWILLGEAVQLIRQVALALDYAHRQGVLHRDIKPANVMLETEPSEGLPYRPVVTDLGLAKLAEGGMHTMDGTSMGTPAYMSPEQAMGRVTDARSDVYSLGILLFELAVGRLPFPARNLAEALQFHVNTPPPAPRGIRPDLPEALERIILQSIEKDPARRFQNAGALADALHSVAASARPVVSAPAGAGNAISLLTQYQQSLVDQRGASILFELDEPPASNQDRIQVLAPDHTTRLVTVKRPQMTIGRGAENDIPIDDGRTSREHARIDFDGSNYKVTDLNSTNGTFLDSYRLVPGVPQPWNAGQGLRIGDNWLRLLRAGMETGAGAVAVAGTLRAASAEATRAGQPGVAQTHLGAYPSPTQQFSSRLAPSRLQAGQIGRITIRNQGSAPDTYTLVWWNPDEALNFTPPDLRVQVNPGKEVVAEFRAEPRRSNFIGSDKTYAFSAQISPENGAPQVHHAEVFSRASLPAWAIPVLLLLCLALAAGVALLGSIALGGGGGLIPSGSNSGANSTQTALVAQTQVALGVQTTGTANAATAAALENANQATKDAATATAFGQATGAAQTATAQQANAQTQSVQTATAQFSTLQAGVAQTSQAQQATQQAVLAQTAAAANLTAQAGAYQTSAAQTAIAAQLTGQAQSATLTAAAQRRAAYIYAGDGAAANDYRSFLQSQGYTVDLIPMTNVLVSDFSTYKVILIGADTGNSSDYTNNPWGDAAEVQATYIANYGRPVLGLGQGGVLFFQAIGLFINWGQSWIGSGNDVYAVDPAAPYWSYPENISMPGDQIVKLYDADSPYVAVYLPGSVATVKTIGRQSDNAEHFQIISENGRFLLWGFDYGPAAMSSKGSKVFINILWNLAP